MESSEREKASNARTSASVRTPGVTCGLTSEGVRLDRVSGRERPASRVETSVRQEKTVAGCAPVIIERCELSLRSATIVWFEPRLRRRWLICYASCHDIFQGIGDSNSRWLTRQTIPSRRSSPSCGKQLWKPRNYFLATWQACHAQGWVNPTWLRTNFSL